jgi:hypothetical protein
LRAPRKKIEKTGRTAEAIASRVGNGADEVKFDRETAEELDSADNEGQPRKPGTMTAAYDTHSPGRPSEAARGPIFLLIVSILPL